MIVLLLLKYWKYIVGVVLICGGIAVVGGAIYNSGYDSSEQKWEARIAERDKIQENQTLEIIKLSKSVIITSDILTKQSIDNLDKILSTVNNKPLYTIVDGKCNPSQVFSDTYVSIIREGKKK